MPRSLLIGTNAPYDVDETDGRRWPLLAALRPEQLVIPSHTPPAEIDRLVAACPTLKLVHVRVKGNLAWWPGRPLLDVEWAGTPSPIDTIDHLRAAAPDVEIVAVLWNEPDLELPGDPDNGNARQSAWLRYRDTAATAMSQLKVRYSGEVKVALAPLSQGNPERFAWWLDKYRSSGLWRAADVIADHNYFPADQALDHPDWGGRHLMFRDEGKPIDILEANDNATLAGREGRDRIYGMYADLVARLGVARSLSLFTLPGMQRQKDKPSWWFIDLAICQTVRHAVDAAAVVPDEPAKPPADVPPIVPTLIKAVDVSSNQNPDLWALQGWIGDGCQLLVVKSYQAAEQAGLAATTVQHVRNARAAGCWTLPYVWLYRSVDPRESVRTALELFRSTGETAPIIFLDCETYEPGPGRPVDPGPSVDQLLAACDEARKLKAAPVVYTGGWWLESYLEGDRSRLAGLPLWLASYNDRADLELDAPLGMRLVGHQYTSTPVDWSAFDLAALTELAEAAQSGSPPQEPAEPENPPVVPPDLSGELAAARAELVAARSALGVATVDYAGALADQLDRLNAIKRPSVVVADVRTQLSTILAALRQLKPAS